MVRNATRRNIKVKLRRNSSSTIIPLKAVRWAGQLDHSQRVATPAAAREINESEPVTQRWLRRENASTSMITTPAMLTISSGAIKDRLTSGLVAWSKNILIQRRGTGVPPVNHAQDARATPN